MRKTIARWLEGDYDVVMYDARGRGRSEAAKWPNWDEAEFASWAEAKQRLGPKAISHPIGAE